MDNSNTWLSRFYGSPGINPDRALPRELVETKCRTMDDARAQQAMFDNRHARELMMLPTDWTGTPPALSLLQLKYDGIHLGYRPGGADIPFTREGVDMLCASHLLPGLRAVERTLCNQFGGPFVLFGEYVHIAGFEAALGDMKRGKGTGAVMLFDAVPLDVWQGRAPSPTAYQRLEKLRHAWRFSKQRINLGGVGFADTALLSGDQTDDIEVIAGSVWEQGLEGLVVKDATSPFSRMASRDWQRLKRKQTIDVPILAVELRGGREGPLRAILVQLPNGQKCKVGVGFSESQRKEWSQFRSGRMVELTHLGFTGNGLLRSPSFKRFRDDKAASK
jgi:ATP-dependent DNA ligase